MNKLATLPTTVATMITLPATAHAEAGYRDAGASHATAVDGVGIKAACVQEPTTTPPSTTLVVLLSGERLLRVTQGFAACETLKRFAQLAIGRIG